MYDPESDYRLRDKTRPPAFTHIPGPRRFFKTTAGPEEAAYPVEEDGPTVYYARMLKNVSFAKAVGAQSLTYETTEIYDHIFNLEVAKYIEEDSVVLCFGENNRWYTIDKVIAPPPSSPSSYTEPRIITPCCPQGLPLTIYATFTGICTNLNGTTIPLTWSPTQGCAGHSAGGTWTITTLCEGLQFRVVFGCIDGGTNFFCCLYLINMSAAWRAQIFGGTCSPLMATFSGDVGSILFTE